MSLTSNLNQANSAIRRFFGEHLPQLRAVSRQLNKRLKEYKIRADGSQLAWHEKTIAGGAIDYRIRALFSPDFKSEVLTSGSAMMGHKWSRKDGIYERLLSYRLVTTEERRLSQISIILAYLDGSFRSGMVSTTLLEIGSDNIEEMLDSINPTLVEDVFTQATLAQGQPFLKSTNTPAIGPIFDGSPDVGGADADLIVDGVLIDFKSASECKLKSATLRQLIGYWLLDYSDCYALKRVVVYFTRYAAFWAMDISELLYLCGSEAKLELRELWKEECRLKFEEAEKARRQRKQAEEEAARAKRKLWLAKRKWRLASANAMLANPLGLKKAKLKVIAGLASGKTNYAHMSPHERAWLDEDFARAFMPFDDWQSGKKKS